MPISSITNVIVHEKLASCMKICSVQMLAALTIVIFVPLLQSVEVDSHTHTPHRACRLKIKLNGLKRRYRFHHKPQSLFIRGGEIENEDDSARARYTDSVYKSIAAFFTSSAG